MRHRLTMRGERVRLAPCQNAVLKGLGSNRLGLAREVVVVGQLRCALAGATTGYALQDLGGAAVQEGAPWTSEAPVDPFAQQRMLECVTGRCLTQNLRPN